MDESSSGGNIATLNCDQSTDATPAMVVFDCATIQNEKRSTDDELVNNGTKRARFDSEVMSTSELPDTHNKVSSNETSVESVRLDRDTRQHQVTRDLVSVVKREREDLPNDTVSNTLVPVVLTNAEIKCEQLEEVVHNVEGIKKEVVYDLVGFRNNDEGSNVDYGNTDLATSSNVENVRIKVERQDNSATETGKSPNRNEVRNDISSNQKSKPKITTVTEPVKKKPSDSKKTVVSKDKNETNGNKKSATLETSGGNKKTANNLDAAIERVVQGGKANPAKRLPLLIKFHKDQLKKLTRTVSKSCLN